MLASVQGLGRQWLRKPTCRDRKQSNETRNRCGNYSFVDLCAGTWKVAASETYLSIRSRANLRDRVSIYYTGR